MPATKNIVPWPPPTIPMRRVVSARAVLQNQDYSDNLHQALLSASHGEAPHLHWVVRLLDYVCTAFLVACTNASLLTAATGARLTIPPRTSLAALPVSNTRLSSRTFVCIKHAAPCEAYPRAPPG